MPEMATIEATNFNLRSVKSTCPIQEGLSLDLRATSIRETKFSYPAKIIIKTRFPINAMSTIFKTKSRTSFKFISTINGRLMIKCCNTLNVINASDRHKMT